MAKFERPVFCVSAPRSGSTLLRLIVNAHPDIAVPPPSWLHELIYPHLYSYGDLGKDANFRELCEDVLNCPNVQKFPHKPTLDELIKACGSDRSFKRIYAVLHELYAEATGKSRWGEKTPRDSFWMDEILKDFPDAQFVHIVRDGRDMAIDISQSPKMRPYSLYMGGIVWREYVSAIRDSATRLTKDNFYELRYEDLCADPEGVLKKMCAFLKVDYSDRMLKHYETDDAKAWASDPQHEKTSRPITTEFCEMYKTRLPKGDVAALEHLFADLLKVYGYPTGKAEAVDPRRASQLLQSDIVTWPVGYEYKASLVERRNARRARGVYKLEDRKSLLWGME